MGNSITPSICKIICGQNNSRHSYLHFYTILPSFTCKHVIWAFFMAGDNALEHQPSFTRLQGLMLLPTSTTSAGRHASPKPVRRWEGGYLPRKLYETYQNHHLLTTLIFHGPFNGLQNTAHTTIVCLLGLLTCSISQSYFISLLF